MTAFGGSVTNQKTIIGHPVGLFVLFFTEMWERFSYYGMRAILVLYLISQVSDGGFGWTRSEALCILHRTRLLNAHGGWFCGRSIHWF